MTAVPSAGAGLPAYMIDCRPVSVKEFTDFLNTLLPREKGRVIAARSRQGILDQLEPPDGIKKLAGLPSYWLKLGEGGFVINGLSGDEPAFNVTWYGADAYCRYVGKTLPSAAQWERACVAGDVSYKVTEKYEWAEEWFSADKRSSVDTGLKVSLGGAGARGKVKCSARSGGLPSSFAVNKTFRCVSVLKEESDR